MRDAIRLAIAKEAARRLARDGACPDKCGYVRDICVRSILVYSNHSRWVVGQPPCAPATLDKGIHSAVHPGKVRDAYRITEAVDEAGQFVGNGVPGTVRHYL